MPVLSRVMSPKPFRASSSQMAAPRAHCHTMALYTGAPVARSQQTEVSRWLQRPSAAMSALSMPAFATTSLAACTVLRRISSGSCSTQPFSLMICRCGLSARQAIMPRSSNNSAFVPWVD